MVDQLPANCEKIGWRPDSTDFLLNNDNEMLHTDIALGVKVRIEHLTKIGREIYYNLSIDILSEPKRLWHLEYSKNKNDRSYQIGQSGVLLVRFEDMLFLDEKDNILPRKQINELL